MAGQHIKVGPLIGQVSPPVYWVESQLQTPGEVVGALKLAYQQFMDGMGESLAEWSGVSASDISCFRNDADLYVLAERLLKERRQEP